MSSELESILDNGMGESSISHAFDFSVEKDESILENNSMLIDLPA